MGSRRVAWLLAGVGLTLGVGGGACGREEGLATPAAPLGTATGAVWEDPCGTCGEGGGGCLELADGVHTWKCVYGKPHGAQAGTAACWHPSPNTPLCASGNCQAGECLCTPIDALMCDGEQPGYTIQATDCGTPVEGAEPVEHCLQPGCFDGECQQQPPIQVGHLIPHVNLTQVRATRPGAVAVGGPEGLYELAGGAWSTPIPPEELSLVGTHALVPGPKGRTLAVTSDGTLLRTQAGAWTQLPPHRAFPGDPASVVDACSNGTLTWVLTKDALWRFGSGTWTQETAVSHLWTGSGGPRAIWAPSGGDVVVVGTAGLACTVTGGHCVPVPGLSLKAGGTAAHVADLHGTANGGLLLAVKGGQVLRRGADGAWTSLGTLSGQDPRVYVSGSHEAWAWSSAGLQRWNGLAWSAAQLPSWEATIRAMDCVTPQDCWAVDGSRFPLHWDGAAWTRPTVTAGPLPLGIDVGYDQAWAPTDDLLFTAHLGTGPGPKVTVRRLELDGATVTGATEWVLPAGHSYWPHLTGTGPSDVYVVADGLSHFDGQAWSKVDVPYGAEQFVSGVAFVGSRLWVSLGRTGWEPGPDLLYRDAPDSPWQPLQLGLEGQSSVYGIAPTPGSDALTVADWFHGLWRVMPDGTVYGAGYTLSLPVWLEGSTSGVIYGVSEGSGDLCVSDPASTNVANILGTDATSLVGWPGGPGVLADLHGTIYEVGTPSAGSAEQLRPYAHLAHDQRLLMTATPGGDLLVLGGGSLFRLPAPWK